MSKSNLSRGQTIAGLTFLVLGGCATTTLLPPQHFRENEGYFSIRDEPPLWPAHAVDGYSRRIRLLLRPPRNARAAIRIDTRTSGRTTGYFVRAERIANSWFITERHRFSVGPEQLEKLDVLIARSRLWRIYPEYWSVAGDDIFFDGTEVILERATPEGYRFSAANAYCTAPRDYLDVATQIIDMAGLRQSQIATWME